MSALTTRSAAVTRRLSATADKLTGLPLVSRFPHLLTAAAWVAWFAVSATALNAMWSHPGPGVAVKLAFALSLVIGAVMFVWVSLFGENPLGAEGAPVRTMFVVTTIGHGALVAPHMPELVPLWLAHLSGYFWYPAIFQAASRRHQARKDTAKRAAAETELGPVFDSRRIWGTPGANIAAATDKFGAALSEQGAVGERVGGRSLEEVVGAFPDAYVFHSLRFPGSVVADVDHAVVRGHDVVLVDSKSWRPGAYSWDHHGALLRDGEHFKGGTNHMTDAVSGFWNGFYHNHDTWNGNLLQGRPPTVSGLILLTSSSGSGRFTVDNTSAPRGVLLVTLEELAGVLERMLPDAGGRNLFVLEHLRRQLI